MPSKTANVANDSQAASAAVGSGGSGRNSVTENPSDPSSLPQQILAIVQHKWRNLEKRKKKLDEYKKIGDDNLKADQKEALSHFGEVVQILDLLGDMKKQFETTFTEYEAFQKRQARADKTAQRKRDSERMREMLEIRLVLNTLGDEGLRAELRRKNQVSEAELAVIDKFYEAVEPTATSCAGNKTDAYLTGATDCFERLLRKDEKPFFEKQTYANLRTVLARLYQTIAESSPTITETEPPAKVEEPAPAVVDEPAAEEPVEPQRPSHQQKHSEEISGGEQPSRLPPASPQQQQQTAPKDVAQASTKLEEIVKPGSFSFLQESQISSGGSRREFVSSSTQDQELGSWMPQPSPARVIPVAEGERAYEERANPNPAVWANRSGAQSDATHRPEQQQQPSQQQPQQASGRSRGERGGNRQQHQQHSQQQGQGRNRRSFNPPGGADENNEGAAGNWPQDDADFSEWKSVEAGSGPNRDAGGWIGGADSRTRRGGSGRGGSAHRGNPHRGGGQGSAQQFGDNRRHFNRGPRTNPGPANQQPRSAAVGGAAGQAFAE